MHILSKKEIQNKKIAEETQAVKDGLVLSSFVEKNRKQLNGLQDSIERTRTETTRKMEQEIGGLVAMRDGLAIEVETLEARKREALLPLELKQTDLDTQESRLDDRRASLFTEIAEFEEKRRDLVDMAHGLDDERGRLTNDRQELDRRKAGIDAEALALLGLQKKMIESQETLSRKLAEAESAIQERERKVEDGRAANAAVREGLDIERENINKDRQHLYSQQQTLAYAIGLARAKGIIV